MSDLSSSSGCTRRKRRPWRRKDVTWKRRWTLSTEERWQLRRWWDRLSKAAHSRSRRTRTRRSKSAFVFVTNSYEVMERPLLIWSMRSCYLPKAIMSLKLIQRWIWTDPVCSDNTGVIACMTQHFYAHFFLQANLQGRGIPDYDN